MVHSVQDAAKQFVLTAIQEWGDPEEKRIAAVQEVLNAAGFKATAVSRPVFGQIWPEEPAVGEEGLAASFWLRTLTDTMQRGKYEDEVAHVARMIEERRGRGNQ